MEHQFEEVDCDELRELAGCLVTEWLNEAVDMFEMTSNDAFCCDNQTSLITSNMAENSTPALKQLCLKALERSNERYQSLPISQFCDSCNTYLYDVNWNSLSCSPLAANVQRHNSFSTSFTAFSAETDELAHSRGALIRQTKSETFLQHSLTSIGCSALHHGGIHSASVRAGDCGLSSLYNVSTDYNGKVEHNAKKDSLTGVQNADVNEETTGSTLNMGCYIAVRSDCLRVNTERLINCDSNEEVAYKLALSSSSIDDTLLSRPAVQVSC